MTMGFPLYLQTRRPFSWWVEETDAFVSRKDRITGETALAMFGRKCARYGHAVRAILCDHLVFVDLPMIRVIIIGVHADAGGARAADWALEQLQEVMDFRKMHGPPTKLTDIVDPTSTRSPGMSAPRAAALAADSDV